MRALVSDAGPVGEGGTLVCWAADRLAVGAVLGCGGGSSTVGSVRGSISERAAFLVLVRAEKGLHELEEFLACFVGCAAGALGHG